MTRLSHFQIPGGPKMARAALRKRAIDWPFGQFSGKAIRRLFAVWRLGGPLMVRTDSR